MGTGHCFYTCLCSAHTLITLKGRLAAGRTAHSPSPFYLVPDSIILNPVKVLLRSTGVSFKLVHNLAFNLLG